MQKHVYEKIGETMWEETLENGLKIFVFPKPEFGKCYAFFATRYGGMDTRFRLGETWLDTPMGIAHYLEHKMFDMPQGNALQQLSANGASPNAFTGSAMTGYHFECTDAFWENLRILLTFVSTPYFTEESVEKERGIIGQEIQMIADSPGWQAYHTLMESLYETHPVRNSVAGSLESIAGITAKTLYQCHEAFYTPSNMVLCVAGNVEPEKVADLAREILPSKPGPVVERRYGDREKPEIFRGESRRTMEVAAPILQLGIKLPVPKDGNGLRQRLVGDLAGEVLMGSSSPLYNRLYEKGLINGNFFCGYEDYPGCAFLVAGGESKDPEGVRDAIFREAVRLHREGIDETLFARLKKAAYGYQVRGLNSFEHLCVEQAEGYFTGEDRWTFPELYETITPQDVRQLLEDWVKPEYTALTVIQPQGDRG